MRRTFMVALCAALAGACGREEPLPPPPPQLRSNTEMLRAVRREALEKAKETTVLMDVAYPGVVVSVLSTASGDAVVYHSIGPAIMDASSEESARQMARAFVAEVLKQQAMFTKQPVDYEYPREGIVRFYLKNDRGIFLTMVPLQFLIEKKAALSAAFEAGSRVEKEIGRIASEAPP